ncbi:transducin beta-like protein 3 [Nilaparvata lugens]|uniref:transducin beta-like protein 3 n=1 Tax=Nilaparvata lugens TaxID=108931 RepID=UPI00193E88F6|nr:transducin beta-like protein 3 [Nilaparvata lugens]
MFLQTFEGHGSSVLRVEFLSRGLQLVSVGSDGLMKLWCIKSSECMATFDQHDGKVWALAVSKDEQVLVTGGDDSSCSSGWIDGRRLVWRRPTRGRLSSSTNKGSTTSFTTTCCCLPSNWPCDWSGRPLCSKLSPNCNKKVPSH